MYDETAIYPNYQKAMQYAEQQRKQSTRLADADNDTLEGYILFGGGNTVELELEPESDEDFAIREKFTDEPDTAAQLAHLEKYGYYYK